MNGICEVGHDAHGVSDNRLTDTNSLGSQGYSLQ